MCLKVDNFLGFASLENFGLIYGCLHLVILLISAGSLCVLNPYLFFKGNFVWSIVCSVFLAAVLFTVYACIEFIHGVIQRNHQRIEIYRNTFAIGLVFHPFHLLTAIVVYDAAHQHDSFFGDTRRLDLNLVIPVVIVNFLANFYVLCCINSLYEMYNKDSQQMNKKLKSLNSQIKVVPDYTEVLVHKPPRNSKISRTVT